MLRQICIRLILQNLVLFFDHFNTQSVVQSQSYEMHESTELLNRDC